MDAVAFFSDSLPEITLNYPAGEPGICGSHHKPATALYRIRNNTHICRGCMLLRQAYPSATGKSRLGLGSYMLLSPTGVTYWGNHLLPAPIKRHSATGALRTIVRDLIRNPPEPPWLFVAFARSNSPERLHVNTANDLVFFSGKFLFPGTKDEPPVERLNRRRVIAMHTAAALTKEEWDQCARAQAALNNSPESLAYLQDIHRRFPALATLPIPARKTPEYFALRLLADDT
jgi:hypothetical protein